MRINKFGIWFIHAKKHPLHNDEVCWIWPWRRKLSKGNKILSIGFNGSFKSFKELDKLWEDYAKAVRTNLILEPGFNVEEIDERI